MPKENFALGHVLPEVTGAFFEVGVVGDDGMFHGLRVPTHPGAPPGRGLPTPVPLPGGDEILAGLQK
ncbi:MAG: hypothetical protein AAGA46_04115 [Cyanobacteria bacterium P01_F01_bin.13]